MSKIRTMLALGVTFALAGPALAEKMTATLEGLPARAKAEPVEVRPGTRRFEFQVSVAATSPTGEHDALVCRLDGQVQGRAVVYRVGRGGVLKVNPPGVAWRIGPEMRKLPLRFCLVPPTGG